MRELIYLSERKLRSFQPDKSKLGFLRRFREAEAKGPLGLGGKLALSEDTSRRYPDLARVIRHIDESSRSARWFEEDTLEPGDWVHFEARVNYRIMDIKVRRRGIDPVSALLFWTVPGERNDSTRLLLHGAAEHLERDTAAGPPSRGQLSLGPSTAYGFVDLVQALEGRPGREVDGRQVSKLLDRLEGEMPDDFAAWMAGYARVTANISTPPADPNAAHRILVASPLYVELVGRP
jgi:hypothetical protein